MARFTIRLGKDRTRRVTAPVTRRSRVRSASGHAADRIFVTTTLRLGGVEKPVELSLVCRRKMRRRVLLGRRALAGDFLVDSGRRFLLNPTSAP